MKRATGSPFLGTVIFGAMVCLAAIGAAKAADPSARAQEALQKGLVAAKQKQWETAIRYFRDAHSAAPQLSEAIFNLGLAEAQMPGRELRAIGWFEAYLAAQPDAANVQPVHEQIEALDVRAEANARKVVETFKGLTKTLDDGDRINSLTDVAEWVATLGDAAAAKDLVQEERDNGERKKRVAAGLAHAGRFVEALEIADLIPNGDDYKAEAYGEIASYEVKRGSLDDAAALIDRMPETKSSFPYRVRPTLDLALAQSVNPAKRPQALALVESLQDKIGAIGAIGTDDRDRAPVLADVCIALSKLGEAKSADMVQDKIRQISFAEKEYTRRMTRALELAAVAFKRDRRQEAFAYLREAEAIAVDARRAGDLLPIGSIFEAYLQAKDWDGANAYMIRANGGRFKPWEEGLERERTEASSEAAVATLQNVAASPADRAQAWSDYVAGSLGAPVFTSLETVVRGLGKGSDTAQLLERVRDSARSLVMRLADVREFRNGH